jgi:DNA invertase Pin-like site-specific DNA recombinase
VSDRLTDWVPVAAAILNNDVPSLKLVAYEQVSTARQGRSGLGLEAQRKAIDDFAAGRGAEVLARFTEVESGGKDDRPELDKALQLARLRGATLVIAKLDRLSRNAAFLLTLQASSVRFVACDMPEANNLTVGIMALVAQQEREAISRRTKEALAAAKARGVSWVTRTGQRRSGGQRRAVWRSAASSPQMPMPSPKVWHRWSRSFSATAFGPFAIWPTH